MLNSTHDLTDRTMFFFVMVLKMYEHRGAKQSALISTENGIFPKI